MRSQEFVGLSEGIRARESSVESAIERMEGQLDELRQRTLTLQDELDNLRELLYSASAHLGESERIDYYIGRLEDEIESKAEELEIAESNVARTEAELTESNQERERILEEKQRTCFEIQQRARTLSRDIPVAEGMYSAYAGIGASISQIFQANLNALSTAAHILGFSIEAGDAGRRVLSGSAARDVSPRGFSIQTGKSGRNVQFVDAARGVSSHDAPVEAGDSEQRVASGDSVRKVSSQGIAIEAGNGKQRASSDGATEDVSLHSGATSSESPLKGNGNFHAVQGARSYSLRTAQNACAYRNASFSWKSASHKAILRSQQSPGAALSRMSPASTFKKKETRAQTPPLRVTAPSYLKQNASQKIHTEQSPHNNAKKFQKISQHWKTSLKDFALKGLTALSILTDGFSGYSDAQIAMNNLRLAETLSAQPAAVLASTPESGVSLAEMTPNEFLSTILRIYSEVSKGNDSALKSLEERMEDANNEEELLSLEKNQSTPGVDPDKHSFSKNKLLYLSDNEIDGDDKGKIRKSFRNGQYSTAVTKEDMILYRVYGGSARKQGRYLTPERPNDRMDSKMRLALLQQWKNAKTNYCEVYIPAGTKLYIGKAEAQSTRDGYTLPGGATQIVVTEEFTKTVSHYGHSRELLFASNYSTFNQKANSLENSKNSPMDSDEGRV